MEHDYTKRGYLLPEGCKDLIDVLKRNQQHEQHQLPKQHTQLPKEYETVLQPLKQPAPLPPIKGEIIIPAQTSVSQLATLLGLKQFQIIADVMQLGFFVTAKQPLSFEIIASVARKHGFIAKKAT
jgi:hypothetical protein